MGMDRKNGRFSRKQERELVRARVRVGLGLGLGLGLEARLVGLGLGHVRTFLQAIRSCSVTSGKSLPTNA